MTEFEYSVQIDEFIYYPAKGLTQLTGQRICPLLNPIIVRREKAEQKPIEVVGS